MTRIPNRSASGEAAESDGAGATHGVDPINVDFGSNVKRLRLEQHLTKTALANMCDFSRPFILGIERGSSDVRLTQVDKLATALGVAPSQLLEPPDDKAAKV